jgi:aspartyl-tRNA(Asn)/glutamyl-tRNA(Gln) amidotransferase subunit C
MSISITDVEHVAKLARLEFSQTEKEKLTCQLNTILKYIDKLNEIDTSNIEPLSQVVELNNVLRTDTTTPSLPREKTLKNAPESNDEFFKVPKVIGDR